MVNQEDQVFLLGYSFIGLSQQQASSRLVEKDLFAIQFLNDNNFTEAFVNRVAPSKESSPAVSDIKSILQSYITNFNQKSYSKFWS